MIALFVWFTMLRRPKPVTRGNVHERQRFSDDILVNVMMFYAFSAYIR
jgi:hypothetical protein